MFWFIVLAVIVAAPLLRVPLGAYPCLLIGGLVLAGVFEDVVVLFIAGLLIGLGAPGSVALGIRGLFRMIRDRGVVRPARRI